MVFLLYSLHHSTGPFLIFIFIVVYSFLYVSIVYQVPYVSYVGVLRNLFHILILYRISWLQLVVRNCVSYDVIMCIVQIASSVYFHYVPVIMLTVSFLVSLFYLFNYYVHTVPTRIFCMVFSLCERVNELHTYITELNTRYGREL